jgi:FkbM family methyltransferase
MGLLRRLRRTTRARGASGTSAATGHDDFKRQQLELAVHRPFGTGFGHDLEARFLHGFLGRGDGVLDVGTNLGQYAAVLEDVVGPGSLTLVEPLPQLAEVLRARFPGARVENLALSDRRGRATIRVPHIAGTAYPTRATLNDHSEPGQSGHDEVEVDTTTLDELVRGRGLGPVSLIKVDVEGHEAAVLRGARATVLGDEPIVLMEIEARHHDGDIAPTVRAATDLGLRGHFFDTTSLTVRPVEDFDATVHQRIEDLVGRNFVDYLNNFWFVPQAREGEFLAAASAFLAEVAAPPA